MEEHHLEAAMTYLGEKEIFCKRGYSSCHIYLETVDIVLQDFGFSFLDYSHVVEGSYYHMDYVVHQDLSTFLMD